MALLFQRSCPDTLTSTLTWIFSSFLCYQSTAFFIRTATSQTHSRSRALWVSIVTLIQIAMCYLLAHVHLSVASRPRAENLFKLKVISHVFATMAINYSLTLIPAASTCAIKLLEPMTFVLVQGLLQRSPIPYSVIPSLPLVIAGMFIFCGSPINKGTAVGMAAAFISNVIMAFRNIAVKLERGRKYTETDSMKLRSTTMVIRILMAFSVGVVLVEVFRFFKLIPPPFTYLLVTGTCSSVFHVVFTYISTNVFMGPRYAGQSSVVIVVGRLIVVLMLYAVGHREADAGSFFGLGVCAVGLLMNIGSAAPGNDVNAQACLQMSRKRQQLFGLVCTCVCVGAVGNHIISVQVYNSGRTSRDQDSYQNRFVGASFGNESIVGYESQTLNAADVPPYLTHFRDSFMKRKLIFTPSMTYVLSQHLTTSTDVIREAERVHFNIFRDVLHQYKYALFFDVNVSENKGDPAITVGEMYLLRRLGIRVLFYCVTQACELKELEDAKRLARGYPIGEVVVLLHGGGNMVGYEYHDYFRSQVFKTFPEYHIVMFPQSVYVQKGKKSQVEFCSHLYRSQGNLTMMFRDKSSLKFADAKFKSRNNEIMLLPDMAFQIGPVKRFMSPAYDILWLRRRDREGTGYTVPKAPPGVGLLVDDWWTWQSPDGVTKMETAFLKAHSGLLYLQRGRVLVTDRLHGHILGTLLDIPHVMLDNTYGKLSSYHKTWTARLSNTYVAHNESHALESAVELLEKYKESLPPLIPTMSKNK